MITQNIFDENLDTILSKTPKSIAVAVSGGSDSMALTLLANEWAKKNSVNFIALTVDHRLRVEAKDEAEQVSKWLAKYEIKHKTLTYQGEIPTSNIEAIAREYRYELLCNYVKENKIDYLFIAHNMDEQSETFFLNLSRGSGVYGLCGMPKNSIKNDVNIIRPMLNFTKDEIKEYLNSLNQKWIEDPSNQDDKYKRVRIRKLKSLLEELELSNERLTKTMQNMERVKETIEFFVDECIKTSVSFNEKSVLINREKFIYYPSEIGLRVLANIIQNLAKTPYPPRFESLEMLYQKIKDASLGNGITLAGLKISFNKNMNIYFDFESGRGKKTTGKI